KYAAIQEAVQGLVPEGVARGSKDYPACGLAEAGYYSRIGEAAGLRARLVRLPEELPEVLEQALSHVQRGKSALVEVWVSSPN
ncbi:MAG: hypothetical protein KC800_03730, partial [Candidatus Eremiobacteraeota bacterium]|nr:hypothetical protein [Candidatus Eremiobacteraeota bacterium]